MSMVKFFTEEGGAVEKEGFEPTFSNIFLPSLYKY